MLVVLKHHNAVIVKFGRAACYNLSKPTASSAEGKRHPRDQIPVGKRAFANVVDHHLCVTAGGRSDNEVKEPLVLVRHWFICDLGSKTGYITSYDCEAGPLGGYRRVAVLALIFKKSLVGLKNESSHWMMGHVRRKNAPQPVQHCMPLAGRVAGEYRARRAVCPARVIGVTSIKGAARATRPSGGAVSYGRACCEHLRVRCLPLNSTPIVARPATRIGVLVVGPFKGDRP